MGESRDMEEQGVSCEGSISAKENTPKALQRCNLLPHLKDFMLDFHEHLHIARRLGRFIVCGETLAGVIVYKCCLSLFIIHMALLLGLQVI